MNNKTYYADDWLEERAIKLKEQEVPLFEAGLMLGWLGGITTTAFTVCFIRLLL